MCTNFRSFNLTSSSSSSSQFHTSTVISTMTTSRYSVAVKALLTTEGPTLQSALIQAPSIMMAAQATGASVAASLPSSKIVITVSSRTSISSPSSSLVRSS
mmetsp:Transcript_7946/g.17236  ORF Transcript_7946/g.17236 Transcript_7946/m.17236 type:complete len:101 (+) Transcript_7946:25-327(+)